MYVGKIDADLFSEVVAVRLLESRKKKKGTPVHRITAGLAEPGDEGTPTGGRMDRARWVSSRVISPAGRLCSMYRRTLVR